MPPLGEVRSVTTMSLVITEVLKSERQSCKTKKNCFKGWHILFSVCVKDGTKPGQLWLDLQTQNSQKIGFGISGLGKFIWTFQSLGMFSSVFFWLRFCSSSPRQVCKILCRTEPGADLGHVYFVQSCTRSAHALKSWDIVALSLCLRSSCFSVELSSTTGSLLLLQLYVHASSVIDTNSGKC